MMPSLHEKALKIKAVVLDVDGVLTDGGIGYGLGSDDEIKFFNVRDGQGIKLAMRSGLLVGILSGRTSKANRRRAEELQLSFIKENCHFKAEGLDAICAEFALAPENIMYIGDDLIDLPPMRKSGIAVAVGDAVSELDSEADFRTEHCGGKGAVREALEWLVKEQGKWEEVTKRYYV